MLQKITDLWPSLLRQYQGLEPDEEDPDDQVPEVELESHESI